MENNHADMAKHARIDTMKSAINGLNTRIHYAPVMRPYQTVDEEELNVVKDLIKTTLEYAFQMHEQDVIENIIKECMENVEIKNPAHDDKYSSHLYDTYLDHTSSNGNK